MKIYDKKIDNEFGVTASVPDAKKLIGADWIKANMNKFIEMIKPNVIGA